MKNTKAIDYIDGLIQALEDSANQLIELSKKPIEPQTPEQWDKSFKEFVTQEADARLELADNLKKLRTGLENPEAFEAFDAMANFSKTNTQEELDAPSYLDWSNESLGRLTRTIGQYLKYKDANGFKAPTAVGAAFMLISACREANAGELTLELDAHTHDGQSTGDWEIIIRKKESK